MLKLRYKITNFINFIKHHLRIIAHKSTYIAFFTLFERKVIGVILAIAGIIGLFVSLLIRIEYEEAGNQFFLGNDPLYQVILGMHALILTLVVIILGWIIYGSIWILGLQIYKIMFRVFRYSHRLCAPIFKKVKVWLQPLFRWFHLHINFNRCCVVLIYISLGSFIYAYLTQIIEALRFIFRNEDIYTILLIFIMTIIFYIIVTLHNFGVNVQFTDGNIVFGLIFFILLVSWKLNLGVSISDCFQNYNQDVVFFIFFILLILNFLSAKLKKFSLQFNLAIISQIFLLILKLSFTTECSSWLFITSSGILSLFTLVVFFQDAPKKNRWGTFASLIITMFLIGIVPTIIIFLSSFMNADKFYILDKLFGVILISSICLSFFGLQNNRTLTKIGVEVGLVIGSSLLIEFTCLNLVFYVALSLKVILLFLHFFDQDSDMEKIKGFCINGLETLKPEISTQIIGVILIPITTLYYTLGIKWLSYIIFQLFITNLIFTIIVSVTGILVLFIRYKYKFYKQTYNLKISMGAALMLFIPYKLQLYPNTLPIEIILDSTYFTNVYTYRRFGVFDGSAQYISHRNIYLEHYFKTKCMPLKTITTLGFNRTRNTSVISNFHPVMKNTFLQLFKEDMKYIPSWESSRHINPTGIHRYYAQIRDTANIDRPPMYQFCKRIHGGAFFEHFIKTQRKYIGTQLLIERQSMDLPWQIYLNKFCLENRAKLPITNIPISGELPDKLIEEILVRGSPRFSKPIEYTNIPIISTEGIFSSSILSKSMQTEASRYNPNSLGYLFHDDPIHMTMTRQNNNSSAAAATSVRVPTESSRYNSNSLGYSISAFSDNDRATMTIQNNNSSAAAATSVRVPTESSRYNPNSLGYSISAFSDNDRAIMALQDNNSSAAVASTNIRVHTESSRYNPNNLGDSISAFSDNDRATMTLQNNDIVIATPINTSNAHRSRHIYYAR